VSEYDPYYTAENGKVYFFEENALAELLREGVVFPSGATDNVTLCVNVNDIFAWACADAEDFPTDQIQAVYDAHKSGPWGTARWACIRRNQRPQPPVEARMKAEGAWDDVLDALPPNTQDAETQALFAEAARRMK
jgi:hypothetical protein